MLPHLSAAALRWHREASVPSVMNAGTCTWLPSGRHALAMALRDCGVVEGSEVLLPAYHCASMVEPVRWLKARPVFYRIDRRAQPDVRDLSGRCTPATRAVVVFHPFGVVLDLHPLRDLSTRAGITLLEDCAHAFFGARDGRPVGALGDVAIASPRKFFPTFDGGCVISTRAAPHGLRWLGLRYDLRSAWNIFELSRHAHQRRARAQRAPDDRTAAGRSQSPSSAAEPVGAYRDERFAAATLGGLMSRCGRLVMNRYSVGYLVERRRRNYDALHAALGGLSGARPLHDQPGTDDPHFVPYVFPLLLAEDAEPQHARLKAHGVPMYRWERLAPGDCPVSREFEQRLVQLPCHQELSDAQIGTLAARVRAVLR